MQHNVNVTEKGGVVIVNVTEKGGVVICLLLHVPPSDTLGVPRNSAHTLGSSTDTWHPRVHLGLSSSMWPDSSRWCRKLL